MMRFLFTGLRALIYMTCFILLWGWVALGVRRYDLKLGVALPEWAPVPGLAAMIGGGVIVLACVAVFVSSGSGTPAPFDPPREFVAVGPYKYVRNPMYIGALIVLIGFGLWQKSASILLFALMLAMIVHLFVLLLEEPDLARRFGSSYLRYKQSVNRWLPGRSRRAAEQLIQPEQK